MPSQSQKTYGPENALDFLEWMYRKPTLVKDREVFALAASPRDEPAQHVLDASVQAAGHNESKVDERGTSDFRNAAAGMLAQDLGIHVDPERGVLATNGALNAMFISLAGLLGPGDEALIPTPQFYYWNSIGYLNASAVLVPCSVKDDWAWDMDAIEAAITPRTRVFLYSNPCNPTGYVPSEEDFETLAELAERHNLVVIEDLAYERFTHTIPRVRSAATIPGLAERTIVIYSLHKNFTMHAWRAGFLAGPPALVEPLLGVATWVNLRVNHITQAAAAAAMGGPREWIQDMVRPYRDGYVMLRDALDGDPGITIDVPTMAGTMGFLDVTNLGLTSEEASERLLFDYGIVTVPGSCFGPAAADSGEHIRIPFALVHDYPGKYETVVDLVKSASADIRGA